MTSRFRRGLGSIGLGVAVIATGLAARVVRTRLRGTAIRRRVTPDQSATTTEAPQLAKPAELAQPTEAAKPVSRGRRRRVGNRRIVTPRSGGGWSVGGGSRSKDYRTQAEAGEAARSELLATGGGELVVKGRDGKVREQSTIGKADPRDSTG